MSPESIVNRKALRDYHVLERYEAGIELKGSEVKSIRAGKANISDAFARIENGEVIAQPMHFQERQRRHGCSHCPVAAGICAERRNTSRAPGRARDWGRVDLAGPPLYNPRPS